MARSIQGERDMGKKSVLYLCNYLFPKKGKKLIDKQDVGDTLILSNMSNQEKSHLLNVKTHLDIISTECTRTTDAQCVEKK